jgi:GST-like protein
MTEKLPENNFPTGYVVPEVWTWDKGNGGAFASINRPIAGPTHDKELPVGKHPLQLYSLATPNGQKVTIMLEELLAAGHKGAEYDAWLIRIGDGDQFGSGFVDVNPNSKIPAMMDRSTPEPTRIFESGSILFYLAEKFGAFLPKDHRGRTEAMNWLFWQMGLCLCADAYQIRDRPLCHGGQTSARRDGPASRRSPVHGRFGILDRRHGDLALVRQAGAQPVL